MSDEDDDAADAAFLHAGVTRFAELLHARHAGAAGFERNDLWLHRKRPSYVESFVLHPSLEDWVNGRVGAERKCGRATGRCAFEVSVCVRLDGVPPRRTAHSDAANHAAGKLRNLSLDAPREFGFSAAEIERVVDAVWHHAAIASEVLANLEPAIRKRALGGGFGEISVRKPRRKKLASLGNAALDDLNSALPTERWRQELADGDDAFSRRGIAATDRALRSFLEALAKLARPTRDSALPVVQQVVLATNAVSARHEGMIETEEREELCGFICRALAAVGVRYDGDVTEQWREW